jgi:hypothetical protein
VVFSENLHVQGALPSRTSCRALQRVSAQWRHGKSTARTRCSRNVLEHPSGHGRVAALFYGRRVSVDGNDVEPDLAMELELRDELLVACRQLLLGIGTREAAVLVAHIDALLDLDDEVSPGSRR